MAQLPAPEASVAAQDSEVLAVTVTEPDGLAAPATPLTAKLMVTDWPTPDGFGDVEVIAVELEAFAAATEAVACARE